MPLEEPYRSRAIPPGSRRYWSWSFAAPAAREPLLALYALAAQWHGAPAVDERVTQLKLDWWRQELARLAAGAPLHPITRHIAALPRAAATPFETLGMCLDAAATEATGVPLERGEDLERHATALHGVPLRLAAALAGAQNSKTLGACTCELSLATYLAHATAGYRREARAGRVPFPVEELLALGIDNDDLAADQPSAPLRSYLAGLRERADAAFTMAADALAAPERPALRHLAVLAVLGRKRLRERGADTAHAPRRRLRLGDLVTAWSAARGAAAGR